MWPALLGASLLEITLLAGSRQADASGLSELYADALAQDRPAKRTPVGAGTGALGDPHVLTAAHVIAGCHHLSVTRDATSRPVTLIGMDNRLDVALLSDTAQADTAGSALAQTMEAGNAPPMQHRELHVVGFGQPGHATREPVSVAVRTQGFLQGLAETPLLSLTGSLVAGTSGSPVLDQDGTSIGMVVGQLKTDHTHSLAVRSVDLLRFLAYFGLEAVRRPSSRPVAQAVLVQCVD